jgi:hypothetical protein
MVGIILTTPLKQVNTCHNTALTTEEAHGIRAAIAGATEGTSADLAQSDAGLSWVVGTRPHRSTGGLLPGVRSHPDWSDSAETRSDGGCVESTFFMMGVICPRLFLASNPVRRICS